MKKITTIIISLILLASCARIPFVREHQSKQEIVNQQENLNRDVKYLKAHLRNGDVYVLQNDWKVENDSILHGYGTKYNMYRLFTSKDSVHLKLDDVAIFETNIKLEDPESSKISTLSILTSVDVGIGVLCITNPKACFGSCPTFYLEDEQNIHAAQAEGFSSAVAPWLEYADIDALNVVSANDTFSLYMKNEALETHCVSEVLLRAVPVDEGEFVLQGVDNQFYACESMIKPVQAVASEGDVLSFLENSDLNERFSPSNPKNMCSPEEIFLSFEAGDIQNPGLMIDFRQSMMSTYIFYSAMGYMGNESGKYFTRMSENPYYRKKFHEINQTLGGIDVYLFENNSWVFQGKVHELGPVAVNRQLIHLKKTGDKVTKVKLVLNAGTWRLDHVAVVDIQKKIQSFDIQPCRVEDKGVGDDKSLDLLNNQSSHLVSMPGSSYRMYFKLPGENQKYQLFLQSKGYYIEWMRDHWLKDKNRAKLWQMVMMPKWYYKSEARRYKTYEKNLEHIFWDSRINTDVVDYYSNK